MGLLVSKAFIPPDDLLGCVVNMTGVEEGEEGVVECLAPFAECISYTDCDWFWGFMQVMTLMAIYGYILFYASNMLSQGSELLLLVPSLAGLVGSVVLPILGAVPDGAIMLFSGLGPDAQNQLTVGIGTIAGSTIMLLTLPWGGSILLGRVPIGPDGTAAYKRRRSSDVKGTPFLTGYGVTPEPSIKSNAAIMVVTSLIYLVIQGPGFKYATDSDPSDIPQVASDEHDFALAGLVLACIAFIGYIVLMMKQQEHGHGNHEFLINAASIKAIEDSTNTISLAGVIAPIIAASASKASDEGGLAYFSGALLDSPGKMRLENLLKPFFKKFDTNGDGQISAWELKELLSQLGEDVSGDEAALWMRRLDPDQSGSIATEQFTDAMLNYISEKARKQAFPNSYVHAACPAESRPSHDPDSLLYS